MRKLPSILLLAIAIATLRNVSAEIVYRAGEGWSAEHEGEVAAANAPAQMRKAEELEGKGDFKKAIAAYRHLVKKWPKADLAAKAQVRVGMLYEKIGDFDRAFDAYSEYLSKYPHGEDFEHAVESEVKVARMFLEGAKKRVLGVPFSASPARAQQMFESIVKNAPYSKFAPLSQFNIGRALEKQGKTDEALLAYQTVLVKYPNDPVAADAQYQIGYINLEETRTGSYNPNTTKKAREAFEDFIARYPSSEKIAQARENLKALGGRETKGSLEIARFYDKQKKYKAAYIYYTDVAKQDPSSPDGQAAKKRMEELEGVVGEEGLRSGPEKAETGAKAKKRRKFESQVSTAARPDYAGPPVVIPDEIAPEKPKIRTSPGDIGPVPAVEPALPKQ
jgi:outer membrane protein assembly factor BamD